jgi:hypothetical protein
VLDAADAGDGKLGTATDLMALSDELVGRAASKLESRPDGRQVRVYG